MPGKDTEFTLVTSLTDDMLVALVKAPSGAAESVATTAKTLGTYIRSLGPTYSIGTPGAQGFGVGICQALPAGMSKLYGTDDPASDNYGNYLFSDGSVMVWIPAFYYKYGTGANGFAINVVSIKAFGDYVDVATANAAGYALHRAFYDGGVVQPGFFVDKYKCSNNAGIASSLKNGNPLSTNAAHNPLSGLTGAPANFYYGVLTAAKTRGASFFPATLFQRAALALLSLAHAQASASTAINAWYDASGVKNYPKGCNNNALGDANDAAILYVTDGYSNCGKTGSANFFARTTHNGQNCGVADLNGLIYEVCPGLATATAVTGTITAATQANPCVITVAAHGRTTGDKVSITGVVGMTQLNNTVPTVTVVDPNTLSLNGVDSTAYTAYASGGTIAFNKYYVLKTSVRMKNMTGGLGGALDLWGTAAQLAANYDVLGDTYGALLALNSVKYFGNAAQVFSEAVSGLPWQAAGAGIPLVGGTGGTNAFGSDYLNDYRPSDMCPIAGGHWGSGADAGVWLLSLSHVRGNSADSVGFRAALYL